MLLLALGGFIGNFVFSLTDRAQNGFFKPTSGFRSGAVQSPSILCSFRFWCE
jgi:hypothetical protein